MHIIDTIEVNGFRGQKKAIRFSVDPHASFIIGRNGTGKTTLINLIRAALIRDLSALSKASFESITIKLADLNSNRKPSIKVEKVIGETQAFIRYGFRERASGPAKTYDLLRRETAVRMDQTPSGRFVRREARRPEGFEVLDRLQSLFKLTWLGVERNESLRSRARSEEEYVSAVDEKLRQVFTSLTAYFSKLDSLAADETYSFQKEWFLSSLSEEEDLDSPNEYKFGDYLVSASERKKLSNIFEKFGMGNEDYFDRISTHIQTVRRALRDVKSSSSDANIMNILFVILNAQRLHNLVESWDKLQDRQENIYLPKTNLVDKCNEYLYDKVISIDRGNRLQVWKDTEGEKYIEIPPESLSSGEKQFMIFLGEALLQNQGPYIYLADEPELSLHVDWQESLVKNLLTLNPNAQILFATHSPDIVSVYQKNLIRLEKLVL